MGPKEPEEASDSEPVHITGSPAGTHSARAGGRRIRELDSIRLASERKHEYGCGSTPRCFLWSLPLALVHLRKGNLEVGAGGTSI